MPSLYQEIETRKHDHSAEDEDVPVERDNVQVDRRLREEGHDPNQGKEEDGEDIERQACSTEIPATGKHLLAADALDDKTADGDDVGSDKGAGGQGGDDVEGDRGTKGDQREQHGHDVRHNDCVEGDVIAGTDLRSQSVIAPIEIRKNVYIRGR